MKNAGVVGAGGAGFPTYRKLDKKADTIILNCSECEPLFSLHRLLLEKFPFEILSALNEIKTAVEAVFTLLNISLYSIIILIPNIDNRNVPRACNRACP